MASRLLLLCAIYIFGSYPLIGCSGSTGSAGETGPKGDKGDQGDPGTPAVGSPQLIDANGHVIGAVVDLFTGNSIPEMIALVWIESHTAFAEVDMGTGILAEPALVDVRFTTTDCTGTGYTTGLSPYRLWRRADGALLKGTTPDVSVSPQSLMERSGGGACTLSSPGTSFYKEAQDVSPPPNYPYTTPMTIEVR